VTDHDLVTRLRQRIDQLADQRDQARAERDHARARASRWYRRFYDQRKQLELWRQRAKR
jgi:hypothetical protein